MRPHFVHSADPPAVLKAAVRSGDGSGGRYGWQIPDLSDVERWLADNEVLDPEQPGDMFELLSKPGLFRRLRRRGKDGQSG